MTRQCHVAWSDISGNTLVIFARWFSFILFAACCMQQAAHALPFDCKKDCGIHGSVPYPNLIVGVIDGVADFQQSKKIFDWARHHGYLAAIPASADKFWDAIQPVSIRLSNGQSMTVLMAQWEAQAVPLKIGDWARFAPHRGTNEKPPEDQLEAIAYWKAVGCVLILCRDSDEVCSARYKSGIYRLSDGAPLKADGKTIDGRMQSIDPHSMLPR
jgi:hypothetical protein